MKSNQTVPNLAIQALIVALFLFGLMQLVGALAINPGVGEGVGIAPDSFRYRVGVGFESYGVVFAVFACWPVMLADLLGLHHAPTWLWYLCFPIAGIGWVLLWHFSSRQLREIRRVIQA